MALINMFRAIRVPAVPLLVLVVWKRIINVPPALILTSFSKELIFALNASLLVKIAPARLYAHHVRTRSTTKTLIRVVNHATIYVPNALRKELINVKDANRETIWKELSV